MKNSQEGRDQRSKSTNGTRPRRSQVTRACNWCRLNRIKCDDNQPCRNCAARGGECSSDGRGEVRSLPQATREIERLKTQIKSLEMQLEEKRENRERHGSQSSDGGSTSTDLSELFGGIRDTPRNLFGTWTSSLPSTNKQLYGPSSPFYYVNRLSSSHELNQQVADRENRVEELCSTASVSSLTSEARDSQDLTAILMDSSSNTEFLSYAQENYFLGLFWESYFSNLPILDESEFREEYKSLWVNTPYGQRRKPSPLVDIVMALCMQYAMTFIPRAGSDPEARAKVDRNDSSIAGRGFFRRCQSLLAYEMESPSINTLQCHILSALYLRNASFTTREHITIAVAARLAYLLGIHQKPPAHLPQKEQELRKRLFWCICTAENQLGLNLGHPILVSACLQSCGLPSTSLETASEAWQHSVTAANGITFLNFQVEHARLITAVRSIDTVFGDKCGSTLIVNGQHDPYYDSQSFEDLAKFLSSHLQTLRDWVEQCPQGIKTPRRGGGRSFSTDRSPLEIDPLAPLWLQRQSILLELLYHDQAMCLYGPFLRFSQAQNASTTLADRMALHCLQHAMATTNIIYQVLTETDILNGWHEAYKYTWNAATSILAFIFGYPLNQSTQSAWRAISTVTEIFDIFGNNFAIAARATIIIKDLANKAESLMEGFRPKATMSIRSSPNLSTSTSIHHKPSSIDSGIGTMTPVCGQQSANILSIAPGSIPMFDLSNQPITMLGDQEDSTVMSMEVDHQSLMDHEVLSANELGFQFSTTPFFDFDATYNDNNAASGNVWSDGIVLDTEFGPRSS